MNNINGSNNLNFTSYLKNATAIATTSTSMGAFHSEKELIKVEVKDITVEISYKQRALYSNTGNITITAGQNAINNNLGDRVWKEIYGLKDGRMTLLQVIYGKHIPAQYIPESYKFEGEE